MQQEKFQQIMRHPEIVADSDYALTVLVTGLPGAPSTPQLCTLKHQLDDFSQWTPGTVGNLRRIISKTVFAGTIHRDMMFSFLHFVAQHGLPAPCRHSVVLNEICVTSAGPGCG